ncbi:hypothetical protein CVT24_011364 [Panaeolus cyanescens]|uniref:Uncharacterized protein n=1 Tax=Panaeolus cyanescens TaxID=181874 RepID=A0A409YGN4_9AGAR|nr:hypothetical protein CVT24_011364 [Panaeolus cyanescens]
MITFVVSSKNKNVDQAALDTPRPQTSPKRGWTVPPSRGGPPLPSPRLPQPYSPRRPSPLGFNPPIESISEYDERPSSPLTPDRLLRSKTATQSATPDLPETHRPLAGWQRRRSQPPPPPLVLHPMQQQSHRPQHEAYGSAAQTHQPTATAAMTTSPPSPTPSSASSLSLYSADSAKKRISMEIQQKGQDSQEERQGIFCCFSFCGFFKPKRQKKELENKILGPPRSATAPATPPTVAAPQMRENRHRPPPLDM